MSEDKKYLLTLGDIVFLHGIMSCGLEEWEGFLREHVYHQRTCHNITQGGGVFMCSACGAFTKLGAVMDCSDSIPQRYCPNCGARIEVES